MPRMPRNENWLMYDIYPVCERIYEKYGQSAVFEFVLTHYPEIEWVTCDPCEISSPTQNGACLVCGTTVTELLPNGLDLAGSGKSQ